MGLNEIYQRLYDTDSVLLLEPEVFREVVADEKLRIIQLLREKNPESIREVSREIGRSPSAVLRDLDVLEKADVVEFEIPESTAMKSKAKKPVLKYEVIGSKPFMSRQEDNY